MFFIQLDIPLFTEINTQKYIFKHAGRNLAQFDLGTKHMKKYKIMTYDSQLLLSNNVSSPAYYDRTNMPDL